MENDEYESNEKAVADQATENESAKQDADDAGEYRFDDWALI